MPDCNNTTSYHEWHPFWDLLAFDRRRDRMQAGRGDTDGARETLYPIRFLRYWFMDHLLRREFRIQERPLDVCEVGVGGGHLLAFVNQASAVAPARLPVWVKRWDAVSKGIEMPKLEAIGYDDCIEVNIEQSTPPLPRQYDVLILLHILEHLHLPELAMDKLLRFVKPGGLVIGGGPTIPDFLRPLRERQLRKEAESFGHVSVISAQRLKRFAMERQMGIDLLTGAYMIRATGSFIENSRAWLRFNLILGACTRGWLGEIYWALRKPSYTDAGSA